MAHSDEIKKAQDAVLVLVKDLEDALEIANLQILQLTKAYDQCLVCLHHEKAETSKLRLMLRGSSHE